MENKISILSCIKCEKDLTKNVTTSFLLTPAFFEENNFVMDFIKKEKDFAEINELDRICLACYKNAEKFHEMHEKNEEHGEITDVIESCMDIVEIKVEHNDPLQPAEGFDINKINIVDTINIPGYSRVPINKTTCVIKNCKNKDLEPINKLKRSEILSNHCLYVPNRVKICSIHAKEEIWDKNTIAKTNKIRDFNERHIMEMMTILKLNKSYFSDFQGEAEMDQNDDDDY